MVVIYRGFNNTSSIFAMVGIYSLTGSVSSLSGVVPSQLLISRVHDAMSYKFPGSWNVVPQYMVHLHMEQKLNGCR